MTLLGTVGRGARLALVLAVVPLACDGTIGPQVGLGAPGGNGAGGPASGSPIGTLNGVPSGNAGASQDAADSDAGNVSVGASSDAATALPPTLPVVPMPIISQGAPAYASTASTSASAANDKDPAQSWSPLSTPAWIAYDLSAVPAAGRGKVLVVWYDRLVADWVSAPNTASGLPRDYTIEVNGAAGGGAAPTSGWRVLTSVQQNTFTSRQHEVDMGGANWLRMDVSQSAIAGGVSLDLDVYDASGGITDSWLFMGDSITFISLTHAFCDLPKLVNQGYPKAYPAIIDGAVGGTTSANGLTVIQTYLANFPGKFVVLAYGTNDHPTGFSDQMSELIQAVIAAGKVPVIPRLPWPHTSDVPAAQQKAAIIDQLYLTYPAVLKGPDLFTFFENNPDLIPAGDVHPNSDGQEALRKQWSATILGTY